MKVGCTYITGKLRPSSHLFSLIIIMSMHLIIIHILINLVFIHNTVRLEAVFGSSFIEIHVRQSMALVRVAMNVHRRISLDLW